MSSQDKIHILSLKSIYQFLTVKDYPIYSIGIITRDNRRGLTLTKFWQDNILMDFRKERYGKQIWRRDGGRNRYLSDICNRSRRLPIYREYAQELRAAADAETILRQIRQFIGALTERNYQYDVFCKKLQGYLRLLGKEDESFSREAAVYFQKAWKEKAYFEELGREGCAFFCGWFLVFLMLHALAGNGEGESFLAGLRRDRELTPSALGRRYFEEKEAAPKSAVFLTSRNTQLTVPALASFHFYGREKEMFELRELVREGGKYLISGIGGVGKTELMRQFLKCCEQEALADAVCVIQYEGNLMSSFVRAFPQIQGRDLEAKFQEVIARIRLLEQSRVLILIDNMDRSDDEKLAVLASLPASVLITSRLQELEGFVPYPIEAISKSAGGFIFRDNYGKPLTAEDKRILAKILENDTWRHALTLRFLGHAASENGWNLSQLYRKLGGEDDLTSVHGQDGYGSIRQLYQRMYAGSRLKKSMGGLLRLLSVMPYQSYSQEFADEFLQDYAAEGRSILESLEELYSAGWLERRESGYAMHPFVAECVRTDGVRESDIELFLRAVAAGWRQADLEYDTSVISDLLSGCETYQRILDTPLGEAMLLIPSVLLQLKGKYSLELLDAGLIAYGFRACTLGTSGEGLEGLLRIKRQGAKLTEDRRATLYLLLCTHGYGNRRDILRELHSQRECAGMDHRIKTAFLNELIWINYYEDTLELDGELEECLGVYGEDEETRVSACLLYATAASRRGDAEAVGNWIRKGVEAVRAGGREREALLEPLLSALIAFYLSVQHLEEAQKTLEEYTALVSRSEDLDARAAVVFYQGTIASHQGQEGFGIPQLEEARRLNLMLWEGTAKEMKCTIVLSELAIAYNKAGRQEEAVGCYQDLLRLYTKESGFVFERHRTLNNLGVAYLDMEKPEEALKCLEESYELVGDPSGLGAGEVMNNLSKAWRMLDDREKEVSCLKEALPILERFYGAEHPKVKDGKKRLQEC